MGYTYALLASSLDLIRDGSMAAFLTNFITLLLRDATAGHVENDIPPPSLSFYA